MNQFQIFCWFPISVLHFDVMSTSIEGHFFHRTQVSMMTKATCTLMCLQPFCKDCLKNKRLVIFSSLSLYIWNMKNNAKRKPLPGPSFTNKREIPSWKKMMLILRLGSIWYLNQSVHFYLVLLDFCRMQNYLYILTHQALAMCAPSLRELLLWMWRKFCSKIGNYILVLAVKKCYGKCEQSAAGCYFYPHV